MVLLVVLEGVSYWSGWPPDEAQFRRWALGVGAGLIIAILPNVIAMHYRLRDLEGDRLHVDISTDDISLTLWPGTNPPSLDVRIEARFESANAEQVIVKGVRASLRRKYLGGWLSRQIATSTEHFDTALVVQPRGRTGFREFEVFVNVPKAHVTKDMDNYVVELAFLTFGDNTVKAIVPARIALIVAPPTMERT